MAEDGGTKTKTEKSESRSSKKNSRQETKDTRGSAKEDEEGQEQAVEVIIPPKRVKPEDKVYDLDRDSFSKGVDPRDEEGNKLDVLVRIQKPLTWVRLASGVRIVDLHEQHFEGVLAIMKVRRTTRLRITPITFLLPEARATFMREEALCKSLRVWEDEESVESLMGACTMWMRDGCSVAAVQEGTNELLGALVLRVVTMLDHTRTFSRIRPTKCGQLVQGEAYQKILAFRCHMHKVAEVFDKFDITSYLRIYAICVRPSHRGKGIGMALLHSAMQVGAALGQRVVMGIITTAQTQTMCIKLGMRPIHEVYYAHWVQDGLVVFDDPGPGNYSAIVMAKKLERVAQF